jgi:sulfur carrier protein
VQITVHGQPRQADDHTTLTDIVQLVSDRDAGIAVALNNVVVPRSGWAATVLNDDDRVDVVTAVQGG